MDRLRFAPSPTGYLHLGGARTALYNFLVARQKKGVFILRIEDTDRERSKPEYTKDIQDALRWLGMEWDEGPYFQSQRSELYKRYIERLKELSVLYPCVCSKEDIEKRKKQRGDKSPGYDGWCRENPPTTDRPYVMRFRVPRERVITLKDGLRGKISVKSTEIDDFVAVRSDGTPTYNLVCVIDDIEMGITCIIRGDDHLTNSFKQTLVYQAIGRDTPEFYHIPLIYGQDKKRLSKRHGAMSVNEYKRLGYLPEAMVNFLARLGWGMEDKEVFSMDELIRYFDIDKVSKSPAIFNPDKLDWLNSVYLRKRVPHDLAELLKPFFKEIGIGIDELDNDRLFRIISLVVERSKTLKELAERSIYFFSDSFEYTDKGEKLIKKGIDKKIYPALKEAFSKAEKLDNEEIERILRGVSQELGCSLKDVAQSLRAAITGTNVSPGIFETVELIGKDRVIKRIDKAMHINL